MGVTSTTGKHQLFSIKHSVSVSHSNKSKNIKHQQLHITNCIINCVNNVMFPICSPFFSQYFDIKPLNTHHIFHQKKGTMFFHLFPPFRCWCLQCSETRFRQRHLRHFWCQVGYHHAERLDAWRRRMRWGGQGEDGVQPWGPVNKVGPKTSWK